MVNTRYCVNEGDQISPADHLFVVRDCMLYCLRRVADQLLARQDDLNYIKSV